MKLIVGLGNPGRQYVNTPHNVGFQVVDLLSERARVPWALERRFEAETATVSFGEFKTTLMKPLTYMNLSGRSVAGWLQKNGGEPGEVLAISDDINLPLGRIRIRPAGSHGGHKGLLSLINSLGTLDFPRLRIGVKPEDEDLSDVVEFVLKKMRPGDRDVLKITVEHAADAVETMFAREFNSVMNHYNKKIV